MKKLQLFWGKSTQNKVVISIILLILSCCILAACVTIGISTWMLLSNTSNPPASVSFTPEETLPVPTLTPLSGSPTKDISQELAYLDALKISTEKLSGLWNEFTIFTSYASQYPEALDDPDWCDEFEVLLNDMDDAAESLKELPPAPEKLTELHRIVLELSTYTQDVTRVMRLYLDTRDETLVNELKPLQEKLFDLQIQLDAEIERLENK